MHRRRRLNIVNRDILLVLVYDLRGYLLGDDLAENGVGHGVVPLVSCWWRVVCCLGATTQQLQRTTNRLYVELPVRNAPPGAEKPPAAQAPQPADGAGNHYWRGGGHYHGRYRQRGQAGSPPADGKARGPQHPDPLVQATGKQ